MSFPLLISVLALLTIAAFYIGRARALGVAGEHSRVLHSRPNYYGYFVSICCFIPAALVMMAWYALQGTVIEGLLVSSLSDSARSLDEAKLSLLIVDIKNLARGDIVSGEISAELQANADYYAGLVTTSRWTLTIVVGALALIGIIGGRGIITKKFRARNWTERVTLWFMIICSTLAILTTVGIIFSLLFESFRFFEKVSPADFLFGLEWSPQTALRKDQVAATGLFGAIPLLAGTLLISFIAMCVAAPVGLLAAVYMAEYAPAKARVYIKPLLEILAGVPTVVYGFFAALTVAPVLRQFGIDLGITVGLGPIEISSESALAAGMVMGIMIIPFVSSLSDDVITAVPQAMREGSYGLGATKSETIRQVILPAALPGIVGALLLAVSRAIGETMIVVMAAGLAANLTANPLEAVTTVTVQIVTLLIGDQEFDSAKTLAAFALGLILFCITLALNVFALHIVNKYREQYD